jgi:hypothetical protein
MKSTAWIYAAAIIGTSVLAFLLAASTTYALIGVAGAAFIGVLAWSRNSAARLGNVAVALLIGIPLVPGLQETRQPQLLVLLTVSAGLLLMLLRLALIRHRSIRLPLWTLIVLVVLTSLTVAVVNADLFRLLSGYALASVLALGIALSSVATEDEKQHVLGVLTVIAIAAAAIAIVESINRAPIYQFTAFQIHSNPLAAFRASSFLGHPLVLCVFLSFVAIANTVRPNWSKPLWITRRLVTVGIPLAGAAVSGSRSIALFAAVGILSILIMRQEKHHRRVLAFGLALVSAALGYFALSTDSVLAQRFGSLTADEQSVRLGGWAVVQHITEGIEVFIGGGPRSVAAAYQTAAGGASFGTVDNQFLTAYADFGLVGLTLLVVLAVLVAAGLRRRDAGPWTRTMIVASTAPLAAFFVMDPLSWPILSLLFGLGAGAITTPEAAPAEPARPTARLRASLQR